MGNALLWTKDSPTTPRQWLELANDEKLGDDGFEAMHFQADAARL
jgi:hypothetical protein